MVIIIYINNLNNLNKNLYFCIPPERIQKYVENRNTGRKIVACSNRNYNMKK